MSEIAFFVKFHFDAVGEFDVISAVLLLEAYDILSGLTFGHVVGDCLGYHNCRNAVVGGGLDIFPFSAAVKRNFRPVDKNDFIFADATEIFVDLDHADAGLEVVGESCACGLWQD